jgi:hypothetical protein
MKRVQFAKPLVQSPPEIKHRPSVTICFGSFSTQVDPNNLPERSIFGSPSFSQCDSDGNNGSPMNTVPSKELPPDSNLNSNSKRSGWHVKCSRCLDLGHSR